MFYLFDIYFRKCITKIVNQLDFLSLRIRVFFEAHLYRIIYKKNIENNDCKIVKKTKLLKIKIVKLMKIYGKEMMKLKINFYSKSIKFNKLQKKALLLGGPYEIGLDLPPLFITVH